MLFNIGDEEMAGANSRCLAAISAPSYLQRQGPWSSRVISHNSVRCTTADQFASD